MLINICYFLSSIQYLKWFKSLALHPDQNLVQLIRLTGQFREAETEQFIFNGILCSEDCYAIQLQINKYKE